MFEGQPNKAFSNQNKAFSNQDKGDLGSRITYMIYIYMIYASIWQAR